MIQNIFGKITFTYNCIAGRNRFLFRMFNKGIVFFLLISDQLLAQSISLGHVRIQVPAEYSVWTFDVLKHVDGVRQDENHQLIISRKSKGDNNDSFIRVHPSNIFRVVTLCVATDTLLNIVEQMSELGRTYVATSTVSGDLRYLVTFIPNPEATGRVAFKEPVLSSCSSIQLDTTTYRFKNAREFGGLLPETIIPDSPLRLQLTVLEKSDIPNGLTESHNNDMTISSSFRSGQDNDKPGKPYHSPPDDEPFRGNMTLTGGFWSGQDNDKPGKPYPYLAPFDDKQLQVNLMLSRLANLFTWEVVRSWYEDLKHFFYDRFFPQDAENRLRQRLADVYDDIHAILKGNHYYLAALEKMLILKDDPANDPRKADFRIQIISIKSVKDGTIRPYLLIHTRGQNDKPIKNLIPISPAFYNPEKKTVLKLSGESPHKKYQNDPVTGDSGQMVDAEHEPSEGGKSQNQNYLASAEGNGDSAPDERQDSGQSGKTNDNNNNGSNGSPTQPDISDTKGMTDQELVDLLVSYAGAGQADNLKEILDTHGNRLLFMTSSLPPGDTALHAAYRNGHEYIVRIIGRYAGPHYEQLNQIANEEGVKPGQLSSLQVTGRASESGEAGNGARRKTKPCASCKKKTLLSELVCKSSTSKKLVCNSCKDNFFYKAPKGKKEKLKEACGFKNDYKVKGYNSLQTTVNLINDNFSDGNEGRFIIDFITAFTAKKILADHEMARNAEVVNGGLSIYLLHLMQRVPPVYSANSFNRELFESNKENIILIFKSLLKFSEEYKDRLYSSKNDLKDVKGGESTKYYLTSPATIIDIMDSVIKRSAVLKEIMDEIDNNKNMQDSIKDLIIESLEAYLQMINNLFDFLLNNDLSGDARLVQNERKALHSIPTEKMIWRRVRLNMSKKLGSTKSDHLADTDFLLMHLVEKTFSFSKNTLLKTGIKDKRLMQENLFRILRGSLFHSDSKLEYNVFKHMEQYMRDIDASDFHPDILEVISRYSERYIQKQKESDTVSNELDTVRHIDQIICFLKENVSDEDESRSIITELQSYKSELEAKISSRDNQYQEIAGDFLKEFKIKSKPTHPQEKEKQQQSFASSQSSESSSDEEDYPHTSLYKNKQDTNKKKEWEDLMFDFHKLYIINKGKSSPELLEIIEEAISISESNARQLVLSSYEKIGLEAKELEQALKKIAALRKKMKGTEEFILQYMDINVVRHVSESCPTNKVGTERIHYILDKLENDHFTPCEKYYSRSYNNNAEMLYSEIVVKKDMMIEKADAFLKTIEKFKKQIVKDSDDHRRHQDDELQKATSFIIEKVISIKNQLDDLSEVPKTISKTLGKNKEFCRIVGFYGKKNKADTPTKNNARKKIRKPNPTELTENFQSLKLNIPDTNILNQVAEQLKVKRGMSNDQITERKCLPADLL